MVVMSFDDERLNSLTGTAKIKKMVELADTFKHSDRMKAHHYATESLKLSEEVGYSAGASRSSYILAVHAAYSSDFAAAFLFLQKALETVDKTEDSDNHADILNMIGVVHTMQRNYKDAIGYFFKALEIAQNENLAIYIYINLGILYKAIFQYEKAIKYYLDAKELNDNKVKDKRVEALINSNIGTLYYRVYDIEKAISYFLSAEVALLQNKDNINLVIIYTLIGDCYKQQEKLSEAKTYFEKALTLAHLNNNNAEICDSLSRLGNVEALLGEKQKGFQKLQEALTLCYQFASNDLIANILKDWAGYFYKEMDYVQAEDYIQKAIEILEKFEYPIELENAYKLYALIAEAQGDYQKALKFFKLKVDIRRSLYTQEKEQISIEIAKLTQIKEKEREIVLLQKRNELQSELLEKTEQIKRQNQRLKLANEELNNFANIVSHDLKEPLRTIGSYTTLLQRKMGAGLSDELKEYMNFIVQGVKNTQDLLDDLLVYVTIDLAKYPKEWVSLQQIMLLVENNLKTQIQEKKAKIIYNDLPKLPIVPSLLLRIMQNLIGNALKFSKQEDVLIEIHAERTNDDQETTISVKDNGIGIDEQYQDFVFKIFQQLHPRTHYSGTGIGLAICKKIVQQAGGKIWYKSEIGVGTIFFFSIPD